MARDGTQPFVLQFLCLGFIVCTYITEAYEKNCDYWDPSTKDNTNYLDCKHSGCCGSFKGRHCCRGPIVPVAVTFGVVIAILVIAAAVSVCYVNYTQRKRRKLQTIPEIQEEEIPVPSPPVRVPLVYNTPRLQSSTFTPQPFRTSLNFLEQEQHPPPSFLHPPRFVITKSQ